MSISQQTLREALQRRFEIQGQNYRKFKSVRARPAIENEEIVSWVSTGRETSNTARQGDYVVENQTGAREQYIIGRDKFATLYELDGASTEPWSIYRPKVRALRVDNEVMSLLSRQGDFHILTSWGEPQLVSEGDMLVTPLSGQEVPEYYRIAIREFEETYALETCTAGPGTSPVSRD